MDVDDNVGGEQGALPFFKVTSCLPDVGCTTRTLPNTAQALATNHGQLAQEGNEPCRNESLNGTWFRGIGGHNWVYPSVSSMPPSVTDRHSTKRGPSTANYFVIIRHDHLTPFSRAEGPKKCQTNACVHFIRSCQKHRMLQM